MPTARTSWAPQCSIIGAWRKDDTTLAHEYVALHLRRNQRNRSALDARSDFAGGLAQPVSVSNAPDFTLLDQSGEPWSLSDQRGRAVVLFFLRGDW